MENFIVENVGIISLIPIIITIVLAIKIKNINLSLFAGVLSGVILIVAFGTFTGETKDPALPLIFQSLIVMVRDVLFVQLTDSYNAGVIVLLVFIGGFVGLLEYSGAVKGLIQRLSKVKNDKKSRITTMISTWISGIVVFFSELGTPLIVGPIFEPIYAKLKISKERLAWILDSTASPVSVLIPFIGWGIYSIGLIRTELVEYGMNEGVADVQATSDFIQAIPLQIYPILSVLIVPTVIIISSHLGKDFKTMARAENNTKVEVVEVEEENDDSNIGSPLVVLVPILVMLMTFVGLLIPFGFPTGQVPGSMFRTALIIGYIFASVSLVILLSVYKMKTMAESVDLYFKGTSRMMGIIIMLVLAWALSSVSKTLGTPDYIATITQSVLSPSLVPALIFLTGALISFSTGTSWGTFSILMPIAFALANSLDVSIYPCIGAVLSGGLFGDHCSPISDTTMLSSAGAKCNHIDHVKTQLPYALLNGVISFFTFVLLGMGVGNYIVLIAIVVMIISYTLIVKFNGEKIDY